jgi:hypothetical protein
VAASLIDSEQSTEYRGSSAQFLSADPKSLLSSVHLDSRDDGATSGCGPRILHGPPASFDVPMIWLDALFA